MEFELLGWPAAGPKLALDYREFGYAGKFVMSNTGKAVAVERTDAVSEGASESASETYESGGSADPGPAPATDAVDVVDPDGTVLAAVAFNADRTDPATAWLRYLTVRADRQGEGIGPRLVSFAVERLRERGYERVRIAVNNPFAYEALYRAGFAFTGEETGIAELVLEWPADARSRGTYQAGLDVFRDRDPDGDERAFLDDCAGADPPGTLDATG